MIELKGYKHDYEQNFFKNDIQITTKIPKKLSPAIKPISNKRKEVNKLYEKAKRDWRKKRTAIDGFKCQISLYPDGGSCARNADRSPHHTKGRVGKLLYDSSLWLAACKKCHRNIHDHPEWAYQQGFLVLRN